MSMSYKDIIILLNAGYTKEEIAGMDDSQPDPQPAPAAIPHPNPQPAPAAIPQPEPQPDPQPAPQPEPAPDAQTAPAAPAAPQPDLLAAIRELTAAVQANNRAAADMGANIIDPIKVGQQAMAGIGGLKIN